MLGVWPRLRFEAVVIALASAMVLANAWEYGRRQEGIDFYNYWVGVSAWRAQEQINLYDPATDVAVRESFARIAQAGPGERQRQAARFWQEYERQFYRGASAPDGLRLPFFLSTPFLYAAVAPLVTGRYDRDLAWLVAASVIGLALLTLALLRRLRYPPAAFLYVFLMFTALYDPFLTSVRVGNVSLLQLGALGAFLLLDELGGRRPWCRLAGGAVLGALVLFKPNLALVPVFLLAGWCVERQWRRVVATAGGMVAGTVVAFACGAWAAGTPAAWLWWLRRATGIAAQPFLTVDEGNFALARVLETATGLRPAAPILLAICLAGAAVAFVRVARRPATPGADTGPDLKRDVLLVAAGVLVPLIAAPLVWVHYLMLALPALLVLAQPNPAWPHRLRLLSRFTVVAAYLITARLPILMFVEPSSITWAILSGACNLALLVCVLWAWAARPASAPSILAGRADA